MKKLTNLSMTFYSDNKIFSEKIKNVISKTGGRVYLKTAADLLGPQPESRGRIIMVELENDFTRKLPVLTELKKRTPGSVVIGLVKDKFFESATAALGAGVDYLLTKPINYSLLPHLLANVL